MPRAQKIKLFLLDMDGTFYLDDLLLPGAKEFLQKCNESGIKYTFLTNNSSKSKTAYLQKLDKLGVHIPPEQMFTSGDATILYMKQTSAPTEILLIGTKSLEEQFISEGYTITTQNPQIVVLGFDTGITYQKLTDLCNAVRTGLPYIATHPDFNCPVENGYIPDIGAVIAFVQAATGRLPDIVVGKPNKIIAEMAATRFGVPINEICMVGDRLYTDIALGRHGVQTALVLSGESSLHDAKISEFKADYIFKNLADMATNGGFFSM